MLILLKKIKDFFGEKKFFPKPKLVHPKKVLYYIVKSSRLTSPVPYAGPSCEWAGVEPGKWYRSAEDAQVDADKLNKANPVGFTVVEDKNG